MAPVASVTVKTPLSAVMPPLAVRVPVAVNPEVAVINPEIVGVAVQDVPVTVKSPPNVVNPVPNNVRVGFVVTLPSVMAVVFADPATIVEPSKVKVPGVVADPIVFIDEAPLPNVLVVEAPVARVVFPEEVSVVKEPVP